MPELREVFEMATKQVEPDVDAWRVQQDRQRRRSTNRKLGAYAVVLVLAIAAALIAIRWLPLGSNRPTPAEPLERPEGGVAIVDLDGTVVGTLGHDRTPEMRTLMIASYSYGLAFSPAGDRVALSDGTDIFTMNPDGADLTKIAEGRNPAWSPDGSTIAFVDKEGIHVIAPDGSGRLTIVPNGDWPVWSPDGRRIAYSTGGQPDPEHGIYVVDADGGEPTRLTREWDGLPSWHPDGTTITFTRIGTSQQDLYSVAADGGARPRPLVTGPDQEANGVWSPSASMLAYGTFDTMFGSDREDMNIRVLDPETGEDRVVVEGAELVGWTPDGKLIVLF
jgi:Tol biopolymer transport system component